MSEDYNSYQARFGETSPTDMMDKIIGLEADLRKARSFTSANHAARDVLDVMCTVAEKSEYFESISDEFIAEVYGTVGRTYDLEVKNVGG